MAERSKLLLFEAVYIVETVCSGPVLNTHK